MPSTVYAAPCGTLPALVGLIGRMGSGKDSVAESLSSLGYPFRLAYAEPLKRAVLTMNPLAKGDIRLADFVSMIGWDGAKRTEPEVRRILQRFGDAARELDEDVFLRPVERWIRYRRERGQTLILTDVRRANEARLIREYGGAIVRVERPSSLPVDGNARHVSETDLDDFQPDAVIRNDGPLSVLPQRSLAALTSIPLTRSV